MRVLGVDHVQIAMPKGSEDLARGFYGEVLGMKEIPKPQALAGRGGCWFAAGAAQVHLGAEEDFRPAKKAHPALVVEGFEALVARCSSKDWTRSSRNAEPLGCQAGRMRRLTGAAACTYLTLSGIVWS